MPISSYISDFNELEVLRMVDRDTYESMGDILCTGLPKEGTVFLMHDHYWKVVELSDVRTRNIQYTITTVPCRNRKLKKEYINIMGEIPITTVYITRTEKNGQTTS